MFIKFRLKWSQVWKVYVLSFLVLGLFMVAMIGLTLLRYSHNLDNFPYREQWLRGFWTFLLVTTILLREFFLKTLSVIFHAMTTGFESAQAVASIHLLVFLVFKIAHQVVCS